MQMKYRFPIFLAATLLLSLAGAACVNGDADEDIEVTIDTSPALPLDECMTQYEINHYFAMRARNYEDSVRRAFSAFLKGNASASWLEKDLAMWENYKDAALESYRRINMGGFCGSAAPLGMADFAYDLVGQLLASFAYEGEAHMQVTDQMVDDAYDRFLNFGIDTCESDGDYPLKEKRACLQSDKKAWSRWMLHRARVAGKLTGADRERYERNTNELRRMKLIQLKNQYQDYGLQSDEDFDRMLDADCTDEQLRQYTSYDRMRRNER